ncbi:MAG TPA: sigma-70 family RNA polymerase sigma factor [Terriglobia bacterium]|nr:sigma-70 family RNA polymerase sigma factor [Terriglobia bacterium]
MIGERTEGWGRMAASNYAMEKTTDVAKWDHSAFEQFFLEHFTRVASVLIRMIGDRSRAEELANEAFWKIYRHPLLPSPEGNVAGLLYRTAANLGIDELRARAKRRHYEETSNRLASGASNAADPLNEILREETRRNVRAVLAELKPAQAQILVLRHSGFSYNELAECLGVSRGSVGTMLMRAEADFQRHYLRAEARSGSQSPGHPKLL